MAVFKDKLYFLPRVVLEKPILKDRLSAVTGAGKYASQRLKTGFASEAKGLANPACARP